MTMKTLLESSGISTSELALALGKSKATISQVVNGKYHGRKEVVNEVREFLETKVAARGGESEQLAGDPANEPLASHTSALSPQSSPLSPQSSALTPPRSPRAKNRPGC